MNKKPIYKDASQPIEVRLRDLMSRMTLQDKLAQMRLLCLHGGDEFRNEDGNINFDYFKEHLFATGAIFNTVQISVSQLNEIQRWYLEETPLGIPLSIHSEGIHGAFHENCTTFPACVAMAASFDRKLFSDVASFIGKQLHDTGTDTVYAPNIDVSRDPRWGRVEEHYGEDPYLVAEFGSIYVNEVQKQGVASCIKHFAVHSSPDSGLNLAPVHEGRREMEAIYLYPFRKVIEKAKPKSVMPAYSEIDGEPLHTSKRWLRSILRDQLGFDGFTVSDYGALGMVQSMHYSSPDGTEVGIRALKAGVDIETPDVYAYGTNLENAILEGRVSETLVDEAVERLLRHKFESGLFDKPYIEENEIKASDAKNNEDFVRTVAENSVVLLKNEGKLLPLDKNIGKIALIGPNADRVALGGYSGQTINRCYKNTLRRALEEKIGVENVIYAEGCKHTKFDESDIPAAVEAAKNANVAVVVLGDWSLGAGGVAGVAKNLLQPNTCGEGYDVHSLDLPGEQQELLEAVYATGTPVVLIMESGRPYSICWAKENIPAIMQAWYPGEQGGAALCNLLFGDANPSAKLPISFPKSAGHIPCYYNHKPSSKGFYHQAGTPEKPGRDYVFSSPYSLFEFGEGLSYTTFEYSDLKIIPDSDNELPVKVEVTVRNTGDRAGAEAVLLFVSDTIATVTPYVKQLKEFDKIYLEAGQAKTVKFELGFDAFQMINDDYIPEAEAGEFKIQIGTETGIFNLKKSIICPELALKI